MHAGPICMIAKFNTIECEGVLTLMQIVKLILGIAYLYRYAQSVGH